MPLYRNRIRRVLGTSAPPLPRPTAHERPSSLDDWRTDDRVLRACVPRCGRPPSQPLHVEHVVAQPGRMNGSSKQPERRNEAPSRVTEQLRGVRLAVPSAVAHAQPSALVTSSAARGSRRRFAVLADPSFIDTWMTPASWWEKGMTGESWGRPSALIVARMPSRLSASRMRGLNGAAVVSEATSRPRRWRLLRVRGRRPGHGRSPDPEGLPGGLRNCSIIAA